MPIFRADHAESLASGKEFRPYQCELTTRRGVRPFLNDLIRRAFGGI